MNWRLECNACGLRLPDGAAAAPVCPHCRSHLHIHSDRVPPLRHELSPERVSPAPTRTYFRVRAGMIGAPGL